jgi:[acyl-carrier-protein] S-malonyltransferase
MKPAGVRLSEALKDVTVQSLKVPVVTNVEAQVNRSPERVKPLLVEQVTSPVRWEESMRGMVDEGIERMVEIGPGKVLSGLMKRIDSKIETGNLEDIQSLKKIGS